MIKRLFAIVLLALSALTHAAQPLTVIVPNGAGSLSDTAVRFFAPLIEKELERPVVVQNLPGANGLIGISAYQQLPHDGNSIVITGTQLVFLTKQGHNVEGLEPLHGLAHTPQQILVPANSPAKTVADLLAIQKQKGFLNGGTSHPATEVSMGLLDKAIGTNTTLVKYKQSSQLATDIAGGFIDYTIGGKGNSATAGFVASGQIRVIGMLDDFKVEGFSWNGFFIHADAPITAKQKLSAAISKVLRSPEAEKFHQDRFLADRKTIEKLLAKEFTLIPNQ